MQLFRRFFRFYNEINVYGTTSGRSNDDYKCFIDYYKAIDFPSFCRIQKKYAPKTLGLNCSHTWEQKSALMLAIIITTACKKRRDTPFTHEIPKIIFYGEKIAWMARSQRATILKAWQEPMLWELLLWLIVTMRKTVPWSKGTLV